MAKTLTPEARQTAIDAIWNELDPDDQNEILAGATHARMISRHHLREHWMGVGRALLRVRESALRHAGVNNIQHPSYRLCHGYLMARVPDLQEIDKREHSACQHAMWMVENWPLIESWLARKEQEPGQGGFNSKVNHPTTLRRHYDADHKIKPQGAEKGPTPLARKDARITELQGEIDDLTVENRRLKRGTDNVSEGRDWSWTDEPAAIAEVWLRLYPSKAPQVASKVLYLACRLVRARDR